MEEETLTCTEEVGLKMEEEKAKVEEENTGAGTFLDIKTGKEFKDVNKSLDMIEDTEKEFKDVNKSLDMIKDTEKEFKDVNKSLEMVKDNLEVKTKSLKNLSSPKKENEETKVQNMAEKAERCDGDHKIDEKNLNNTAEEREETPDDSSEFIEFEFSPVKNQSSVNREGSASPDAEAVLDQLYEAAKNGDQSELCSLIFSERHDDQNMKENQIDGEKLKETAGVANCDVNQNKAIINLLKRKTPIEKEHIVSDFGNLKRARIELEKVLDFTNVKNIRNLGSLPIGNLVNVVNPETFKTNKKQNTRRKHPNRTPTPPNISPTQPPIYRPRLTVQNMLNTLSPPQDLNQQKGPNIEKNLIDYSVLTKALTKTLESKLQEGEDNDVKIVIFCNNKPIQSFSVRSNSKQVAALPPAPEVEVSLPPQMSSTVITDMDTQKLLKMPVDTVTNVHDILSQNTTYLSKQINQNLGLNPARIPTIGDVKAILERNRRIASESLARLTKSCTKTKRIPNDTLNMLFKEFHTKDSKNDGEKSLHEETGQSDTEKKDSNANEELEENNLVISDSVAEPNVCMDSIDNDEVKCEQCHKTFKQLRYLNRHRIRVHSSKPKTQPQEEVASPLVQSQEADINKTIEGLLGTQSEKSNENVNSTPHKNKKGIIETAKIDGTEEEDDTTAVKTELLSDSEDQEIQNLLASNEVMNLIETAENEPLGFIAKDVLNKNSKKKAFSNDYKPPVSENGLIEPVYVCEQCGKFYRARKTLRDHFMREHAKYKDDEPLYLYITGNKYQCPICFNNYHSGSELVSHTKKHTGELRSVCKLCGKVYSSVHVLRRHIDNMHSDFKPRPFQCELCEYAASNKWHLKEHYRRHTGEQPYKCPVCVKSFSHQGTMNRHCKTIHKIEIPSQRPYARNNNIRDLPDLPTDSSVPDGTSAHDDSSLFCSESELAENSSSSETDLDLSIVKTEPQEIDVE